MDLFTYLMAKNGQNTGKDLFSYLLGKKASGTYTTFSGTSLNISNSIKAQIKKFMLNSTELTQNGTPSPDNPVDVNVIKGDNNIKISNSDNTEEQNYPIDLNGKNLLDFDDFLNSGNATYTENNGNYIITNIGNLVSNRYLLKVNANKTYTLSCTKQEQTSTNVRVQIYKDNVFIGSAYVTGTQENSFTFTAQEGSIYAINLTYSTIDTNIIYKNPMLEEGSTATSYEPYYNIEYCKIGDYADQIFKNTTDSEFYDSTLIENEWYLKKNIGKVTFDGSDEWGNGNVQGGYYSYFLRTDIIKLNSNNELLVMSDRFVGYANPSDVTNTSNIGITTRPSTSGQGFYIRSNLTNINDWVPWLTENKPTVYYVQATPTYIHISQTDYPTLKTQLDNLYNNAKSYNGQTNITQINEDLPFNISVSVKVANL